MDVAVSGFSRQKVPWKSRAAFVSNRQRIPGYLCTTLLSDEKCNENGRIWLRCEKHDLEKVSEWVVGCFPYCVPERRRYGCVADSPDSC